MCVGVFVKKDNHKTTAAVQSQHNSSAFRRRFLVYGLDGQNGDMNENPRLVLNA